MRNAAVVIPFYHHDLSTNERISFRQCLKVLGHYPIILIVPEGMNEKFYPFDGNVIYEKVSDAWLENVRTYNKMMLSEEFYKRFLNYEYILIYQLDAFVFCDQLECFCKMGYDYIGAPWLYGVSYYLDSMHCIWHVGNGGFSLRKVSSCIKLLNKKKDMLKNECMNEDLFFSMGNGGEFSVAPVDVALKFSFEQEINRCFYENGGNLPFGCHAWERYHFAFWKPYIESLGYELQPSDGDKGEDDRKLAGYYAEQRTYSRYMKYEYDKETLPETLALIFGREYGAITVWGAGVCGREVCALLEDAGVEIDYILDNNCNCQDRIIYHHRVLDVDIYRKIKAKVAIIIAVKKHRAEVADQLESYGYRYGEDYVFYRDIMDSLIRNKKENIGDGKNV